MDELPPFDPPRAHHDDIDTSHLAAETNTTSATHQLQILWAHMNAVNDGGYRGFTDEESGLETGLPTVEARRRCNNLRNPPGYLAWTEESRAGIAFPTKLNRVSIITDIGRAKLGFLPAPRPVPVAPADKFADVRSRLAQRHGQP
jgi:hypothetical protein